MSLVANEAVIKMIIKSRSPIVRHVSRIHRAASDWLFDRSNVDSKIQIDTSILNINSQIFWPKVMSHITMEQSSSFVQHHPCQASLLRKEFRLDELLQNDGEEGTGTGKRMSVAKSKSTPDELVISCSDKFLIREKSDCIQRSGDRHSYGETWKRHERKRRIRRSVEFSSTTEKCMHRRVDGQSHWETCRNHRGIRRWGSVPNLQLGLKEEPGKTKSWMKRTVTQSTVSPATVPRTEAVFSIVREIYGREHDDPMDDFGREYGYLRHFSEYHSSSRSSFWTKTWRESTIREDHFGTVCGTVFQCEWKNFSVFKKKSLK